MAGASIKEVQRRGRHPGDTEAIRETEARTQVSMASWVLCTILLLAALAGAQRETRYDKFLRQHVDNPRTPLATQRYCGIMMMRRRVNVQGGPCKITNTFVHAPAATLVDACSQPPDANGIHSTTRALSLTVCRSRGGNTRPPCVYNVQQRQQRVLVACENGLPVHLDGTR